MSRFANPLALISVLLASSLIILLCIGFYTSYKMGMLTTETFLPNLLSEGVGIILTSAIIAPLTYYFVSSWINLKWRNIIESSVNDGIKNLEITLRKLTRWATSLDIVISSREYPNFSFKPYFALSVNESEIGKQEIDEAAAALKEARREFEKVLMLPSAKNPHFIAQLLDSIEPLEKSISEIQDAFKGKEFSAGVIDINSDEIGKNISNVAGKYEIKFEGIKTINNEILVGIISRWLLERSRRNLFHTPELSPLDRFSIGVMKIRKNYRDEFCSLLDSLDDEDARKCASIIRKGGFEVLSESLNAVVHSSSET